MHPHSNNWINILVPMLDKLKNWKILSVLNVHILEHKRSSQDTRTNIYASIKLIHLIVIKDSNRNTVAGYSSGNENIIV